MAGRQVAAQMADHSVNIQGTFREHSRIMQGTFREHGVRHLPSWPASRCRVYDVDVRDEMAGRQVAA
jgi:hypothetical protein